MTKSFSISTDNGHDLYKKLLDFQVLDFLFISG